MKASDPTREPEQAKATSYLSEPEPQVVQLVLPAVRIGVQRDSQPLTHLRQHLCRVALGAAGRCVRVGYLRGPVQTVVIVSHYLPLPRLAAAACDCALRCVLYAIATAWDCGLPCAISVLMFPAQGVHGDLPDSLSYIDQLAVTSYFQDDQEDEWEPLDVISGV